MTPTRPRQSLVLDAFAFGELVYHGIVREVRLESGSAALGLLMAVLRVLMLVMVFYAIYAILGVNGSMIRGDVILFLVGGILLFFLHNQTIARTLKAGDHTGPLMQHAPMTAMVAILSATLATLYLHVLAMLLIFLGMFVAFGEVGIHRPAGMILPFLLSWASGLVIGLMFLLLKPFAPRAVMLVSSLYMRANMITSGKFFVANLIPLAAMPFFAWNPLFHTIDQMRGAMFVNYFPHNTSLIYPAAFTAAGLVLGMMGDFWLKRNVSLSTGAR